MRMTAQQRIKKQSAAQLPLVQKQHRHGQVVTGYALPGADLTWRQWLAARFPKLTQFAPRHERLWDWFDGLIPGTKPRPRVEVWPRGGAKSSTGELGCVRLGWRLTRRFVLYVSETQPQADKHVQAVASFFERLGVGRALGKYGSSKGWRRDQLRTANGFNVAGIGLDVAARGVKLDEFRPDLIIFDDIDGRHDTPEKTAKKIGTITASLLPAGSSDCAILFLQNLIQKNGIVAQLADGRAEFLHGRDVPTIEPAVRGLSVTQEAQPDGTLLFRITGGEPTWDGQNLAVCESQINDWGLSAFLREAQQEVEDEEGGLWTRALINQCRWAGKVPDLHRIAVAVDPNTKEGGDEAGVLVCGIARIENVIHGFVLEDATVDGGPKKWSEAAVSAYFRWQANTIVAEKNNGGEMVELTLKTVTELNGKRVASVPVKLVHASRGKITRAEPVQKLYEDGRIHHAGHFPQLESQMCTYRPSLGMDSPGRLDACFVAGTLVSAEQGLVCIEDIRPGMRVWTRKGLRRVLNAAMTNPSAHCLTVAMSNGESLTGTGNHPVFVKEKGFVALNTLVWANILETIQENTLLTTDTHITETPLHLIQGGATTSHRACKTSLISDWMRFIGRCGKMPTGQSPTATKSIIRTAIRLITRSKIWNAWPERNTRPVTPMSSAPCGRHILSAYGKRPLSGTEAQRDWIGIVRQDKIHGRTSLLFLMSAFSVAKIIPPKVTPGAPVSVHAPALIVTTPPRVLITKTAPVSLVEKFSTQRSLNPKRPVPVSVAGLSDAGEHPVYNLEVESEPEYYANGILVHNCVWGFTDLMVEPKRELKFY